MTVDMKIMKVLLSPVDRYLPDC